VRLKVARLKNWPHLATADIRQIESWARQYPGCNWGAVAGPDSGFFAVDVDSPKAMMKLEIEFGLLPEGLTNVTSRGYQLIYEWPQNADVRSAGNRPCQGIDIRGRGSYIVIPPSVHPSGASYGWKCGEEDPTFGANAPIRPAPAWLLELLNRRQTPSVANGSSTKTTAYGRRALEAQCGRLALAPEGQRNHTLNTAAFALGQLVAGAVLDVREVVDALLTAAGRCGLGEMEARRTIASGLESGARLPRRVT